MGILIASIRGGEYTWREARAFDVWVLSVLE